MNTDGLRVLDGLSTLALTELVENEPSEFVLQRFTEMHGIARIKSALASLHRLSDTDPRIRPHKRRLEAAMAHFYVKPFDWVYGGLSEFSWRGHGCSYQPASEEEYSLLRGDLALVTGTKVGDAYDLTPEEWAEKKAFVATVIAFDRDTGVATIAIDDNRYGAIRESRLRGKLKPVTLEKIPFDPTGWPTHYGERKPGHWSI